MAAKRIRNWGGVVAGVFAPALFVPVAQASPISWGTPTVISGDSDVSTTGSLVYAYNTGGTDNTNAFGNSSPPTAGPADETVNGVDFLAFNGSNNFAGVASNSNVMISGIDPHYGGGGAFFSSVNAPFNTLSANYQSLLTQGVFGSAAGESPSGNVPLVLTLGNLTPGDTYQFQTWVNDSRNVPRSETVSDGINSSGSMVFNNSSADGGVGEYLIGTFVASGTTETLTYTGDPTNGDSQINALQLRLLPEPGSLSLAGLACIGMMARRRR